MRAPLQPLLTWLSRMASSSSSSSPHSPWGTCNRGRSRPREYAELPASLPPLLTDATSSSSRAAPGALPRRTSHVPPRTRPLSPVLAAPPDGAKGAAGPDGGALVVLAASELLVLPVGSAGEGGAYTTATEKGCCEAAPNLRQGMARTKRVSSVTTETP